MTDLDKLMAWAETHKILSKTDSIGSDGKYYYGISFVDLRAKIRELRGGEEDGKETEIGQQEVFLQRADNDNARLGRDTWGESENNQA